MKGFFKSIFIFLSPVFFGLFVFFSLIRMLSSYVVKHSNQYVFDDSLELLFLGDSHITFSIIDSNINKASNQSKMAEPYFYTFQKLKYIVRKNSIKEVYLGFSYHNLSCYYNNLIDGNLSSVFPQKIFFCLDFMDQLRVLYWNKTKLILVLSELIESARSKCENLKIEQRQYSFSDGYLKLQNEKATIESIRYRAISQFYSDDNQPKSFSHENIYYLKKIISFCKVNNIKISLITTPLHREYLDLVPQVFKAKRNEIISETNTYLINLENLKLLNSSFAKDGDHLTVEGAKILTDSLKNTLE